MLFNSDEILDNFNSSPSVIEVSSESGEECTVEPGNFQALDERFRVVRPDSDGMSGFVGAAAATLVPRSSVPFQTEEVVDTAGSQIEIQLMEKIEEHQSHRSSSPTSFIDTEFEESPESPDDQEMEDSHSLNSYGLSLRSYQPREKEAVVEAWSSTHYRHIHQGSSQVQATSTS